MISPILYRELKLYTKSRAFLLSLLIQPIILIIFFMSSINNVVGHIEFRNVLISYSSFAVPGIVLMTIMFTSMMCAQSIFNERFSNIITLILSAPIGRGHYIIGKILGVSIITILQGLLMLLIAGLGFNVGMSVSSVPLVIVTILIASLMYSAIYIIMLVRIKTISAFSSLINILNLVWMYSAPIFYPVEAIPSYLHPITYVNPATYFLYMLRSQMFLGKTPLVVLLASGIVTLLLIIHASKELKKFTQV